MTIINTLANTFRTSYGNRVDDIAGDTAMYHDALHAATGIGITIDDEVVIQAIENNLRGLLSMDMDINEQVYEALDMLPDELEAELRAFYTTH